MSNSKLLSNLILTTVIIVVAFSIFQYKNYMGSSTIEFTDENSEKSVRMTIHKPKGHIVKKDLEKINEIQANFGNPLVILMIYHR